MINGRCIRQKRDTLPRVAAAKTAFRPNLDNARILVSKD